MHKERRDMVKGNKNKARPSRAQRQAHQYIIFGALPSATALMFQERGPGDEDERFRALGYAKTRGFGVR
eukprot:9375502-Prorocentrum_lima.AAC.1